MEKQVVVIGGGLAGAEAAFQLAQLGVKVKLYEMRPHVDAKAHHTDQLAELVCSNSLKSNRKDNAAGLLKEEMRALGSLIIQVADQVSLPAGQALSVDREVFAQTITRTIQAHPLIEIINEECTKIDPDQVTIIASGPLTSGKLSQEIKNLLGEDQLYFYDAAAPLLDASTINRDIVYAKSRYDKGEADYLNCPFTKEQFDLFYQELVDAERAELKEFEKEVHFEACMPIEVMAKRGPKTLLFGPLKPVGLEREDGKRPYAVVQLRQDNGEASVYNMVGFQTNLKFKEQLRVFRLIPGLENMTIYRYGVMHRNTFLCSPLHLDATLQTRKYPNLFFSGQICGVEGYIESASSGIIAAINAYRLLMGKELVEVPLTTVLGSLLYYISHAAPKHFQPMNANYGIVNAQNKDKLVIYEQSLKDLELWKKQL